MSKGRATINTDETFSHCYKKMTEQSQKSRELLEAIRAQVPGLNTLRDNSAQIRFKIDDLRVQLSDQLERFQMDPALTIKERVKLKDAFKNEFQKTHLSPLEKSAADLQNNIAALENASPEIVALKKVIDTLGGLQQDYFVANTERVSAESHLTSIKSFQSKPQILESLLEKVRDPLPNFDEDEVLKKVLKDAKLNKLPDEAKSMLKNLITTAKSANMKFNKTQEEVVLALRANAVTINREGHKISGKPRTIQQLLADHPATTVTKTPLTQDSSSFNFSSSSDKLSRQDSGADRDLETDSDFVRIHDFRNKKLPAVSQKYNVDSTHKISGLTVIHGFRNKNSVSGSKNNDSDNDLDNSSEESSVVRIHPGKK